MFLRLKHGMISLMTPGCATTADQVKKSNGHYQEGLANFETDRQKALAELDRVKLEIQQHTKAISGIQEEARKSGVPPGC